MTVLRMVFLAALAGAGVWLIWRAVPIGRTPALADRVLPYAAAPARPSRLLAVQEAVTPFPTLERLIRPSLTRSARRLDTWLGGQMSIRRRLDRSGRSTSLEAFRLEQLVWAAGGAGVAAALLVVASAGQGTLRPVPAIVLVAVGAMSGLLLRDRSLSLAVARRTERIRSEFPTVVELLALSVAAGEGASAALERVSRVGGGELGGELQRAVADTHAGATLVDALRDVASRVDLPELRRFVDSVSVAVERGTPLAQVLHAQASDARESARRELIEAGGRKEIAMMVPVVFLVLPISVVFALFPGFYGLSLVSR